MPTWIVPADNQVAGSPNHPEHHDNIYDDLTLINDAAPVVSGGLTGATAATRWVGATASGAPGSGTFDAGDFVIDQTGYVRICTAAGSPGTWTASGGGGTGLAPSGDTTGATDTSNIQGLLTLAGKVVLQAGVFYINESLQLYTGSTLAGAGMGATTIRAKSGFSPTQVGSNTGAVMVATAGNTGQSHITVASLTLDGNQSTISSIPGYADGPESSPLSIWNATQVTVDSVEVLNAVGYSIYLQGCTEVSVTGCRVLSGAGSALGTDQQDGIHFTNCANFRAENNDVDTGTGTAGDDGIAVESYTGSSNGVITGNMIRSAAHGIVLAAEGGAFSAVSITGNTVYAAIAGGIVVYHGSGSSTSASDITITGNTVTDVASSGTSAPGIGVLMPFAGVTISGNTVGGFNNTGSTGILVSNGTGSGTTSDLAVCDNTIAKSAITQGIYVGYSGAGVTDYTVSGNVVDVSSGTAATTGIVIVDSPDGVVANNMVLGSTQSGSIGIEIYGHTTAPTGISVTGNRVKGWATGIEEFNAGAAPAYIVYTGNNLHGCTAFLSQSGTGNVIGGTDANVVA